MLAYIIKIHRIEFLSLFKKSDFPECRHLWGNSAGNPACAIATGEIPWFPNCLCLNFLSSFLLAYLTCKFIIKVQCFQLTENNLIQPLFSRESWSPGGLATSYRKLSLSLWVSTFYTEFYKLNVSSYSTKGKRCDYWMTLGSHCYWGKLGPTCPCVVKPIQWHWTVGKESAACAAGAKWAVQGNQCLKDLNSPKACRERFLKIRRGRRVIGCVISSWPFFWLSDGD